MESSLALDPLEIVVLLLWAVGVVYVGISFFKNRSALMFLLLIASVGIPGVGICFAAIQMVQRWTGKKKQA